MSELIQRPQVGENLREFFRLTGTVRPELDNFVHPSVIVGDLSASAAPVARRHASAQGVQVAAALQNAFFELSAADPNTLAVVTDIYAFALAQDQLHIAYSSGIVVGGTVQTARYSDARVATPNALFVGGTPPAYVLQSASLAGGPINNGLVAGRFAVPSTGVQLHLQPKGLVLLGSRAAGLASGIAFSNDSPAGTLVLTVEWDEYQLP